MVVGTSLELEPLSYEGHTVTATLTRSGTAAADVYAAWGATYGGVDAAAWEHTAKCGEFAANVSSAEFTTPDMGLDAIYVRFYSTDGEWSETIYLPDPPPPSSGSAHFYVATTGSDDDAGTESAPFLTLSNAVAQANAAGQALAGIEFEYILSSPLIRARLTAEIIDSYVRCGKVVCEEGLTERCFGSLSGQQVKNLYTAECDDMEPWEDVDRRVREVLYRYAARGCERVLAVSHGGTIRSLFRGIMGESTPSPMILKNACISVCMAASTSD